MTLSANIVYSTEQLKDYFSKNRISWDQFYPSERVVMEDVGLSSECAVLDVGCGCGGLGLALRDKFGIRNYAGVEINQQAATAASTINPEAAIFQGDFLELHERGILPRTNDAVFSLSCLDWNMEFDRMFEAVWQYVAPGGVLICTFRLTLDDGVDDIAKSFQYINYDGCRAGEVAPYVVINAKELFARISAFAPVEIIANGYWGSPSKTAMTPYDKLCFVAIAARKQSPSSTVHAPKMHVSLPPDVTAALACFAA